MNRFRSVVLVLFVMFAISGCAKKEDEGKVPITTSSDEARKEYIEGRALAEKLLITNSLSHFDKAISLDPEFASAYLARANASFTGKDFFQNMKMAVEHSGKASEGERLLIQAGEAGANGNAAQQKEYLEKLVQQYPNDERAQYQLGAFDFAVQEYDGAIDQFKKASAIDPNYSPVYNLLGYSYRQVGNYPEAEKAFKKYIELIPNDPNPYDSYAELLMKMGRFDESVENYQKALSHDQNFMSSRIGLAMDYLYKGMPDKATAELEKAASMAQNDGDRRTVSFAQMVVDADAGKWDLALKELEKQYALGEKINDPAAMTGDLGVKAALLLEMGKPDEARKAFDKATEITMASDLSQAIKDNAQLVKHYNLALVALAKKDLKTAKAEASEFQKGAAARQNAAQMRLAHQLSGRIAMMEKDHEGAVTHLLQANQQNPYDLYRLALAYQQKGDKAKAKEFSQKAAQFYSLPGLNYAFVRTKAQKLYSAL